MGHEKYPEMGRHTVVYCRYPSRVIGVTKVRPACVMHRDTSTALLVASADWRNDPDFLEHVNHFDAHVPAASMHAGNLKESLPPVCTKAVHIRGLPARVFAIGSTIDGVAHYSPNCDGTMVSGEGVEVWNYGSPDEFGSYASLYWIDRNMVPRYAIVGSQSDIGPTITEMVAHGLASNDECDPRLEDYLFQVVPKHKCTFSQPYHYVVGPIAVALHNAERSYWAQWHLCPPELIQGHTPEAWMVS